MLFYQAAYNTMSCIISMYMYMYMIAVMYRHVYCTCTMCVNVRAGCRAAGYYQLSTYRHRYYGIDNRVEGQERDWKREGATCTFSMGLYARSLVHAVYIIRVLVFTFQC